jgi:hypothetical protein
MNKYKIEGGLNFFDELYKSLDIEDNIVEDDNLCLITNEPLTSNFVELTCGHKFNYIPLYNDIKNHKQKFNNLEGNGTRLHNNEIRCPYCRNKYIGVLPYYQELGLEKINGVNYINPNYSQYQYQYKKCQYLTPITSINDTDETQFYTCNLFGLPINYKNGTLVGENYGDEKYYCCQHKSKIITKYKNKLKEDAKNAKLEIKLKAKNDKLLAKEEVKNAKILAKKEKQQLVLMVKMDKLLEKEDKKKSTENVILGTNVIINCETCSNILKTGPNKGQQCTSKIMSDNLCKRHYNLKHHKITNENKNINNENI